MLEQMKSVKLTEMSKEELEVHCETILKLEKEEIKEYLFYVIDEYLTRGIDDITSPYSKDDVPEFMTSFVGNKDIKEIMVVMLKELDDEELEELEKPQ